jgi:hypothetical protein
VRLTPDDLDALFCCPDFVKQYNKAVDSGTAESLVQNLSERDVERWIKQGRKVKERMSRG